MTERVATAGVTGVDLALANLLRMCFESNVGPIERRTIDAAAETSSLLADSRHPWLRPLTDAYTTAWSYPPGEAAGAAACIPRCRATVEEVREYGPVITSWALQPLIWVNLDAGRLEDARAAADEGLTGAETTGMSIRESRMALNRARIAVAESDFDAAWRFGEQAAAAARRTGETFVLSAATQILADVAVARGDTTLARDLLVSILDLVVESQPPAAVAEFRERIAGYG
jgi:hypothetical protein